MSKIGRIIDDEIRRLCVNKCSCDFVDADKNFFNIEDISPGFSGSTVSNYLVFYGPSPACELDSRFEQPVLAEGIEYYTDRDYTLTGVPSQYIGLEAILLPNGDRELGCGSGYVIFDKNSMGTDGYAYRHKNQESQGQG